VSAKSGKYCRIHQVPTSFKSPCRGDLGFRTPWDCGEHSSGASAALGLGERKG
jgi:hypothetical protein